MRRESDTPGDGRAVHATAEGGRGEGLYAEGVVCRNHERLTR
jgi:hypothetical protein